MPGQPGRSGRKPKPTALKVITGNPGGRPLPQGEPQPELITPDPPDMPHEARREWRRLVPLLEEVGLLAQMDRSTLTGHCLAWDMAIRAVEKGDDSLLLKALAQMRSYISELGLSPSARSRMAPPEAKSSGKGAERYLS